MVFLVGVLLISVFTEGYEYGIIGAAVSVMMFNYFFTVPVHTFAIMNPNDVALLVFFLIAACISSSLAVRFQKQFLISQKNEQTALRLLEMSEKFINVTGKENIIRLGTGELDPRIFPKDKWNQVLRNLTPQIQSLGYLGPLGLPELQEALARHLASCGIHTSPSNILVTSGALQALQLISVALLKPGSTVYTEAPSYMKSLQVFQSAGMRLSGVPMDEYGIQYWKLQNKTSLQSGHHSSILYTIPTNQNPTGITMEEGRRQELIDYCVSCQLPIIEDGAYLELCYAQEQPKTLKELDQSGMVIYLGTASKTLAPGLRIGWIVAPEPIVQRLGDVKMQMDYGASSISQWIFAEFLNSGLYGEYLQELKAILLHRRNCALKALQEHFSDLATWRIPKGGFYIWLTFKKELSVEMIFQEALKHRILLNPGDIYGFEKTNSLRLSFSYVTPEEFALAAETLAQVVRHGV